MLGAGVLVARPVRQSRHRRRQINFDELPGKTQPRDAQQRPGRGEGRRQRGLQQAPPHPPEVFRRITDNVDHRPDDVAGVGTHDIERSNCVLHHLIYLRIQVAVTDKAPMDIDRALTGQIRGRPGTTVTWW